MIMKKIVKLYLVLMYKPVLSTTNKYNAPRTIDGIYLRPSNNKQGEHEVMNLNTRRIIYPMNVTVIPVIDLIIKTVEKMG